MKKIIKIAFVTAFVAVAGYGVYANQKADSMSDLMLANMEALANDDELDDGKVADVFIQDLGEETKCQDGTLYLVKHYKISCFGIGTIKCQSGTYASYSPIGNCYEI